MVLVASIVASVMVWSLLFSFKFAIALITALFIHEYGHFYWMDKEGIKDKDMIFLPPFGAVARAKDPWTSYLAELRIALAGPVAGLLSVLLFLVIWLVYPSDVFLASAGLACFLNLFNLIIPVAILDGGRVIKSILYSINETLGDGFYIFGFILLGSAFLFGYLSLIFVMLVGFFLYQEWSRIQILRADLVHLKNLRILKTTWPDLATAVDPLALEDTAVIEKRILFLESVVNMKKMSRSEMVIGFLVFTGLVFVYAATAYWLSGYISLDMIQIQEYFK